MIQSTANDPRPTTPFWVPIPDSVLFDPELRATDVRVYAVLKRYALRYGDEQIWPTQEHIAINADCHRASLGESLAILEERGHIARVPGGFAKPDRIAISAPTTRAWGFAPSPSPRAYRKQPRRRNASRRAQLSQETTGRKTQQLLSQKATTGVANCDTKEDVNDREEKKRDETRAARARTVSDIGNWKRDRPPQKSLPPNRDPLRGYPTPAAREARVDTQRRSLWQPLPTSAHPGTSFPAPTPHVPAHSRRQEPPLLTAVGEGVGGEGARGASTMVPDARTSPYTAWAAFCAAANLDIAAATGHEQSKSLAIARRLLADGVTLPEIAACTRYLKSQQWRTAPLHLGSLAAEIGAWRMAGRPTHETPPPRATYRSQADLNAATGKLVL